jgi:hypothetical protein
MSNMERLSKVYEKKRADGLVDVKFELARPLTATAEEIAGDILRIEEAIANGHTRKLDFGDLRWRSAERTA